MSMILIPSDTYTVLDEISLQDWGDVVRDALWHVARGTWMALLWRRKVGPINFSFEMQTPLVFVLIAQTDD